MPDKRDNKNFELGKKGRILFYIAIFVLIASAVFILLKDKVKSNNTGLMRVCVHDGETDMPVEGAKVVIPEAGISCETDSEGFTPVLELPVYYDEQYSKLRDQNYGRITVLVYSDGYVPYALFFAHVEPGRLRAGPNVWLFRGEGDPFCVIEGPDDEWSKRIVEEYAP